MGLFDNMLSLGRNLNVPQNCSFHLIVLRILWLDPDTMVQCDISPLYQMPMTHTVAMAQDKLFMVCQFYGKPPRGLHRRPDLCPDPDIPQFNSGVLLIDLVRWEEEAATEKLEYCEWRLPYSDDQLCLNMYFQLWSPHGRGFDILGRRAYEVD